MELTIRACLNRSKYST